MKTAVEWLEEQVKSVKWKFADKTDREAIIQQAKEMEKQQIMDSYRSGKVNSFDVLNSESVNITAEQYYNKTFKSE